MTNSAVLRQLPATRMAFLLASVALGCAVEGGSRPEHQKGRQEVPLEKDGSDAEAFKDAAEQVIPGEVDGPLPDASKPPLCSELAQRTCSVETFLASGVRSCWKGVQFCVEGAWSECYSLDRVPSPDAE